MDTEEKTSDLAPVEAPSTVADLQPKFGKTTLAELGATLPLGTCDNTGNWGRKLLTRRWRMKEERALGDLRDQTANRNIAFFLSSVIAEMYQEIGPHKFDPMSVAARRALISQMYMGDVFYAYIYLRVQALGHLLSTRLQCPTCGRLFNYDADLNTLSVKTVEALQDSKWTYRLKHPFEIRGKQVSTLIMGPARWYSIEQTQGDTGRFNSGAAKFGAIFGSIHEVPELGEVQLAEHEIDEMDKVDIEALSDLVDKHSIGAEMMIEDRCPRCGSQFNIPLDWGYESFFSNSSR